MALFVLLVVALIVGQTWLDWRDANRGWAIPHWAKGGALAAAIAVSLASASSFAAAVMQNPLTQSDADWDPKILWPEAAFLLTMLVMIVYAAKTKRTKLLLGVSSMLVLALWAGYALS